MALVKWTAGDTISERQANDFGIRKGTEAEIAAIVSADREIGSILYNSTTENPQVYIDAVNDERGNLKHLIGADGTEVTVTGTTAVEKKNISFVKDSNGFSGNIITIVVEIKTDNGATTASLRVREDGGGTDRLVLTTTSTSFEIKTGIIDIGTGGLNLSAGRHTLEFFLDDGAGDLVTNRELEVYGI